MGTNYYAVKNKPTIFSPIHIGKSSMGWKFCFHKVCSFENYISDEPLNIFPQWKKFLEEQTKSGNIVIMNECDEIVSLDDFLNMVEKSRKRIIPMILPIQIILMVTGSKAVSFGKAV